MTLPQFVLDARVSGPSLEGMDVTSWEHKPIDKLTRGERIVRFAHDFLVTPEGIKVGQPLRLEAFQVAFILSIFDNPAVTRRAIMSVARRNGKTFLVGVILLAFIIGPEAVQNSSLSSAAMSRDQAALVFNLMSKMLDLSPKVAGTYRVVPSSKRIVGLRKNVEYSALASDARTGHGRSLLVALLDEAGQIKGSQSDFVDMLISSQGSYDDPLFVTISTQAPSDADLLSTWIDTAQQTNDPRTVCHVYRADADADLMDESQWQKANPGLGVFRSVDDLREQLLQASKLPSMEPGARNLLLNQRVSTDALFIGPSIWKACSHEPDIDAFRLGRVAIGLDLSARHDLTAAVCAVRDDDGYVHLLPFVFVPTQGLRERMARDKAPYQTWIDQGKLIAVPGPTIEYQWVAEYLRDALHDLGIDIDMVAYDRWRISIFRKEADDCGFAIGANWVEVGQGFKDMSPRCENFLSLLLAERVRHGSHPLLNMAAANAITSTDPAGSVKLDKSKSTLRIDPLVAAIMAAFEVSDGRDDSGKSYLDDQPSLMVF